MNAEVNADGSVVVHLPWESRTLVFTRTSWLMFVDLIERTERQRQLMEREMRHAVRPRPSLWRRLFGREGR